MNLELAPFLDAGKVFADTGSRPLTHLHTAPGFGVRGVASPFSVGYVDVGFGHGQPVVFSGINYPFRRLVVMFALRNAAYTTG